MKFIGDIDEMIFVAEITPENSYMFQQDVETGLSVIWNIGKTANVEIDRQLIEIPTNCVIFLTEYHQIEDFDFEQLRVVQFNRPFYCLEKHDSDIGCKGALFFAASSIPKIHLTKEQQKDFNTLWQVFMLEVDQNDQYTLEMLRSMLKRMLILSLRIYNDESNDIRTNQEQVGIVREYNYLVEKHFRTYTKVADYAKLLFKSPKTLANIFNQYQELTPLQVINERRMLEAKRLLIYSDDGIQEIADDLGFIDIQAFSNFFKKREGLPPSKFRKMIIAG